MASSVWYQATSTRPSFPAVIHGKMLVPTVLPTAWLLEMFTGADHVRLVLSGVAMVAGCMECTT